jgi:serine/threonine protein kinase
MGKQNGRPMKDFYGILEVSPRARPEVLHAAHKALLAVYHPDRIKGEERTAQEIGEAYLILSDPVQRAKYDASLQHLEDKVIGQYRVLEFIAEGGFGKTYKGEHILVGEPVCIKHCSYVSPQDEAILIQEAKAIWDLRHYSLPAMRNVLKLDDGSIALVMSYIPGLTLEKVVERTGRLESEHVAWIAERVLNALMYMHYQGVIHGDIKPQNIIIQPESHQVVLVDFGLSLIRPKHDSDSKGHTPYFAPPEEEKGMTLLPQSDFYSLGMTMLYALGGGYDSVKRKIVPEDTPDPLCDFIKQLIVRDILARPRWEEKDLCKEIQAVRQRAFGRARSNMKPISI